MTRATTPPRQALSRQAPAQITAERDRTVGTLTPGEVRDAVARFLAPEEVASLSRVALDRAPLGPVLDDVRAGFRGYAGDGVICTAVGKGLDVEVHDDTIPAGMRAGLVPWRLLAQVVADGATPARLTALTDALHAKDRRAADDAARAIVTAGPAVTQLDLLDALADLPAPAGASTDTPPGAAAADREPAFTGRRRTGTRTAGAKSGGKSGGTSGGTSGASRGTTSRRGGAA